MAWFTPFIVPMAIGALSSMASGRNALEGAAIGAATQGLLGGVDFGGASGLFGEVGKSTASNLTPTTTSGFGGASMFGQSGAAELTEGVATSLPQTAGQYSSIYGGDAALQNYDMGMNGIQSQIGGPVNVPTTGNVSGMTAGVDYPDYTPIGQGTAQTNGYVYSPEEIETMANLKEYGGMVDTGDIVENEKLFEGLIGDDMSAGDIMGYTQLANQAYNTQTETPLVDTPDLGPIAKKEVVPQEGKLVAINSPRSDIEKKIKFYG